LLPGLTLTSCACLTFHCLCEAARRPSKDGVDRTKRPVPPCQWCYQMLAPRHVHFISDRGGEEHRLRMSKSGWPHVFAKLLRRAFVTSSSCLQVAGETGGMDRLANPKCRKVSCSLRWQQPQPSLTTSSSSQDGSHYDHACLHHRYIGKLFEETLGAPVRLILFVGTSISWS